MTHDFDRCPMNYCELCDANAIGYQRGKDVGRGEVISEVLEAIRPVVGTQEAKARAVQSLVSGGMNESQAAIYAGLVPDGPGSDTEAKAERFNRLCRTAH